MNMPNHSHSILRRRGAAKSGFTLVEVLAAIAVIAILAAIAVPSIFAAMNRAREAAIIVEVQNLNLALEKFKNHYGFYPPAIGPGLEIDSSVTGTAGAAQMLPYLNKISRNHLEGSSGGLQAWWDNVGTKLDARSSLVFWLNGLCKNKQYPLSGASGVTAALAPYNVDEYWDGSAVGTEIARDSRFDFDKGQLDFSVDNIVFYNQAFGGEDRAYRYLDYKSYSGGAYVDGAGVFVNPKSFQLVSPGMDGLIGGVPQTSVQHDDNIVNFPPGRFDTYVNNNQ